MMKWKLFCTVTMKSYEIEALVLTCLDKANKFAFL